MEKWAKAAIGLFCLFLFFLLVQSTPYYIDLPNETQQLILSLSLEITEGYDTDLEKIDALNNWLYLNIEHLTYFNNSDLRVSHMPEDILSRGWGACFDRSYLLELMAQSMGYKARHISITNGVNSHAISEIKINGSWVLFDSSYNRHYTDEAGNALSLREVRDRQPEINLGYNYTLMNYATYGMNSFHGQFFEPRVPFPDINFNQFLYNIFILDMIPFTYKNAHYAFFALIAAVLAALYFVNKYRKKN